MERFWHRSSAKKPMMRIGTGSQTPINFKTLVPTTLILKKKLGTAALKSDIMTAFLFNFEWAFLKLEFK